MRNLCDLYGVHARMCSLRFFHLLVCVRVFFILYFYQSNFTVVFKRYDSIANASPISCVYVAASLTVFTKTSSHIYSHTNYPIHREINAFSSHKSRTCSSAALCVFFFICALWAWSPPYNVDIDTQYHIVAENKKRIKFLLPKLCLN